MPAFPPAEADVRRMSQQVEGPHISGSFKTIADKSVPASGMPYSTNQRYHALAIVKVKVIPQQVWTGPKGSGLVKAPDFLTFGTTRVVGRQPYAPAAFTTGEIPGTHFQRLRLPQGTWFRRWESRKKFNDTIGNRSRNRSTSSAMP